MSGASPFDYVPPPLALWSRPHDLPGPWVTPPPPPPESTTPVPFKPGELFDPPDIRSIAVEIPAVELPAPHKVPAIMKAIEGAIRPPPEDAWTRKLLAKAKRSSAD